MKQRNSVKRNSILPKCMLPDNSNLTGWNIKARWRTLHNGKWIICGYIASYYIKLGKIAYLGFLVANWSQNHCRFPVHCALGERKENVVLLNCTCTDSRVIENTFKMEFWASSLCTSDTEEDIHEGTVGIPVLPPLTTLLQVLQQLLLLLKTQLLESSN